ncbi:lasso peptide biosynthesis B2 protein [Nonomuraea cavernae]|uniref:lasso peptide biosynthesis B2 protein n=1 Tax=Nonomuraea cavernae TaxID=2045107 RepID=UPI001E4A67ED|nr:lasso peptide biosynthesis B2 protein [Nonomuraea cavernae]
MVVVDVRTEHCHALNSTAALVWEVLRSGGTVADAVEALADRHVDQPRERLRADVTGFVAELREAGLLRPAPPSVSTSAPGIEKTEETEQAEEVEGGERRASGVPMARGPAGRPSPASVVFLLAAVTLLALPVRFSSRLARRAHRRLGHRPLPVDRAERMTAEVKKAAAIFPGRAACFEISLATVLWAAALGHRLDWCWGVLPDPFTFHAWVETQGQRVEDDEDRLYGPPYHRLRPLDTQQWPLRSERLFRWPTSFRR